MYFTKLILSISLNIYVSSSLPTTRHIQTEWVQYFDQGGEGPGSYVYGYDVEDSGTENVQFRHETRDANGTVVGSYGLLEPDGNLRIVHYIADQLGYRANIENTKTQNQGHGDSSIYKDILRGFKPVPDDSDTPRSEITTKSSFLLSAEKNLPFLGENSVHEKHIPPTFYSNVPSESTMSLLVDKLYN